MTTTDYMSEDDVFALLQRKRTALNRMIKDCGFPKPVLTHPKRFSRRAVERWLDEGGVNRAA